MKLSQRGFAKGIKSSQSRVNSLENDASTPTIGLLRKVYKFTGKKIDIYGGDDE